MAQSALNSTIYVEAKNVVKGLRKTILDDFKSLARREAKLYSSVINLDGWELKFPTFLWNGKGTPREIYVSLTLREWL